MLEKLLVDAGFRDVEVRKVEAPVRLESAAECVRFERESFGALHQVLSSLAETERDSVWKEIDRGPRGASWVRASWSWRQARCSAG